MFLVLGGYVLVKKRLLRRHGFLMLFGVFLHLVAVAFVMVPSFVLGVVPLISEVGLDMSVVLGLLHGVLGVVAAVLGVWIVGAWRFRSVQFCVRRKKLMRATLSVWLIALILGFLLFLSFYWSFLFG